MNCCQHALSAGVLVLVSFIIVVNLMRWPAASASNGNAGERGAVYFQTKGCERCHSITGVGGDRAPDLGSVGLRRGTHQIKTQILKGGRGMPPFSDVLTKDEVKALVAFLASCRTDTAPGCRQWITARSPQ
jgi:mono/diheme cytochrome c family protein